MQEIIGICELLLCCCFLFDNSDQQKYSKTNVISNYERYHNNSLTNIIKRE